MIDQGAAEARREHALGHRHAGGGPESNAGRPFQYVRKGGGKFGMGMAGQQAVTVGPAGIGIVTPKMIGDQDAEKSGGKAGQSRIWVRGGGESCPGTGFRQPCAAMNKPALSAAALILSTLVGCHLVDQRDFDRHAGTKPEPPVAKVVAVKGPQPLLRIDYTAPDPDYAGALREAVLRARAVKPDVLFTVQTLVPRAADAGRAGAGTIGCRGDRT